jgi:ADP-ribose pyrophosphatase
MSRFKTLKTEIIHKNPFWEYKKDKFETSKGQKGDYFYLETKGSSFVIPVTTDGRLILVSQYRYLKDKISIEFPCGGVMEKESPTEAAKRELIEETGYEVEELLKTGEFDGLNGLCKEACHVFIGTELEKIGEPQPEFNGEELEVLYRRPDEFEEMIKQGDIWDGQTLAAWTLSRNHVYKIISEYGL